MGAFSQIIDGYERKARLYPALVLLAPVVALTFAFMLPTLSTIKSIAALIITCGGAWLLAQLARDEGKKGEPKLYKKWGGTPSVAIFVIEIHASIPSQKSVIIKNSRAW